MPATARAVTHGAVSWPHRVSARAVCTVTFRSPSCSTVSLSQAVRLASGSTRCTSRSGRTMARAMPGRPAPDPTSTTRWVAPTLGMSRSTTAQLSTWRSHRRGASRGPISPREIPVSARMATNASALATWSPKIARALSGVAGTPLSGLMGALVAKPGVRPSAGARRGHCVRVSRETRPRHQPGRMTT